jgi:PPOX class probable F420-dependent enzyme
MEHMTDTEWREFLEEHRSPAIAAVTHPDGRPHASPIWIYLDGDEIVFTTYHTSVKATSLAENPSMTLVIQDDRPPYRYVVIEGRFTGFDDDPDRLYHWAGKLGGRYMGEDRAEEFARRNGVSGEIVGRMTIERIVAHKNITD